MKPESVAEIIHLTLKGHFGGMAAVISETNRRIVVVVPGGEHVVIKVSPATVEAHDGR